jgi:hypothetical protein
MYDLEPRVAVITGNEADAFVDLEIGAAALAADFCDFHFARAGSYSLARQRQFQLSCAFVSGGAGIEASASWEALGDEMGVRQASDPYLGKTNRIDKKGYIFLPFSTWSDWQTIVAYYGKARLAQIVVGIRSLNPRAFAFCQAWFQMPRPKPPPKSRELVSILDADPLRVPVDVRKFHLQIPKGV